MNRIWRREYNTWRREYNTVEDYWWYRSKAPTYQLDVSHLQAFPEGNYAQACYQICFETIAEDILNAQIT